MATAKKIPSFSAIEEEISLILDLDQETLDPGIMQELDAYIEELGIQEAQKVDGIAQYLKLTKQRINAIKEEAQALQRRKRSLENSVAYIKSIYLATMDKAGLGKLKGNCYSIYVQERDKAVVPESVEGLPDEYKIIKMDVLPDKEKILADLQAGKEVPGCSLGKSRYIVAR